MTAPDASGADAACTAVSAPSGTSGQGHSSSSGRPEWDRTTKPVTVSGGTLPWLPPAGTLLHFLSGTKSHRSSGIP